MTIKKGTINQIDPEQLALIEYAQARIKQKKRLYTHFVVFLIGAVFLIIINAVLGYGKDFKIFNTPWYVFAVLGWFFLFLYHVFNVFITHKFMGKAWEHNQLEKLRHKQEKLIAQLQKQIENEMPLPEIKKKPQPPQESL